MKSNFKHIILVALLLAGLFINSLASDSNKCASAAGFLTSLPPETPVLHLPEHEGTFRPDSIILTWNSLIHTSSYNLQISEAPDFSSLVLDLSNINDTSHHVTGLESFSTYYWRIIANNIAGNGPHSEVRSFNTSAPTGIENIPSFAETDAVIKVYPNPSSGEVSIKYLIKSQSTFSLTIFDKKGQKISELDSGEKQPGYYEFTWTGRDKSGYRLSHGVYICRLKQGNRVFTNEIILIR